jgi:hypothetical protein
MDQPTVTETQQRQADNLANAYQTDMVRENALHRQDIEQAYQIAHNALVSLMPLLNQEEVERLQKSGKSIYRMDDREALKLITDWIKRLREKAASGATTAEKIDGLIGQIRNFEKEKERLLTEVAQQKVMNQDLKQTILTMRTQVGALEQTVSKVKEKDRPPAQQAPARSTAPVEQGMSEPEWMVEWRKKTTFEKDSEVLKVIGETGYSRRMVIIQLVAARLGKNPNNTSLIDAVNRLGGGAEKGLDLVERIDVFDKQGSELGGALPILLHLTDKGKHAFWMLTGQNAQECEFDRLMKHHKTPEHTLLNFLVRDQLVNDGHYEVLLEAPEIDLPTGEKFSPDIVVKDSKGEILYIEVERGTSKDEGYRIQKWRNHFAASHGRLFVYCDKPAFMKAMMGEVNQALKDTRFSSYFSNYEDVRDGKRGQDGSVWLFRRE